MSNAGFIHLHNHSEYSLLDGAIRIRDLVKRASDMGMTAVGLTDHGNMYGAVPFYREALRVGIKPIVGMETYLARDGIDKRGKDAQKKNDHLVLLVKNNTGYKNLLKLSSIAYTKGFYYKPRIDLDILETYSEGLIGLSGCIQGSIAKLLYAGKKDEAVIFARRLESIFHEGDFFIEIQNHGIERELLLIPKLTDLARDLKLPLVATNDCHYCGAEEHEAHDVLLCLQTGKDLDDENRVLRSNPETYLKSPEQMEALFTDHKEALRNTLNIAERCNLKLKDKKTQLPKSPIPSQFASPDEYLEHLVMEGAGEVLGEINDDVIERIKYELEIIREMGFSSYFLIVWDIVKFAKEAGIAVGPGRGSAAGSLVCYILGITSINPLENELIFERFLNPERVSMPDIDIDFCDNRRQEVIDHVVSTYGKENVCQIITFGRMAARAVIRDVGRVLRVPYGEVDKLAKMIPAQPGVNLSDAIKDVPELKNLYNNDKSIKKLLDLSLSLEGLARHASTHAAGLVITPTPLVNHVPLYRSSKGEITTQYEMKILDSIGLLKIDILGLKTLSHIQNVLILIEKHEGLKLSIEDIPIEDPETFKFLGEGKTVAVFQLESEGMRELLKKIQPTNFGDVTAINALYRPGPLGSNMVTDFIKCKHGKKKITYEHPMLEPILKDTYGVILYQEQVMRVASDLAGFSMGQADILRRAMGKKKKSIMSQQKELFVKGAVERGINEKIADRIFELMAHFAGYGFNKSHSAAYAMVSMQTAYLKVHYPAAFMAAAMTNDMGNTDRLMILLEECHNLEIVLRGPDVNSSGKEFDLSNGEITYGLVAIKNMGVPAAEAIVDARKDGPFVDLYDLCERVNLRSINRRALESMIRSGATDSLPGTRSQKMATLDTILAHAQKRQSERDRGQTFLGFFENPSMSDMIELEDVPPWDESERLKNEKESLGFYFSGHPLDSYKGVLSHIVNTESCALSEKKSKKNVVIAGLITSVRVILDRRGKSMAFVGMEDFLGSFEVIVFSSCYQSCREELREENLVVIKGKISSKDRGESKVIADKIFSIDSALNYLSGKVCLSLRSELFNEKELLSLKQTVSRFPGKKELFFKWCKNGDNKFSVRSRSYSVSPSLEFVRSLEKITGVENVEIVL
ncbi:MAG: DNA polymerase III subunit alpha [Candidatus Krumholzibacteriota bacterium]|nr:DNA polymerase III subunit alpha [Candidatus Krumholzibacteriota bacterium]